MNPDDFEEQLQRQMLRPPPTAWREDILTTARVNIRPPAAADKSSLLTGWRALVARFPVAWGAVAAIWLMIIGVNSWLSSPSVSSTSGDFAAASGNSPTIWSLQRTEMSLLADHLNVDPEPVHHRPERAPAPRSDSRREDGFGGFEPDGKLTGIV
jgi:hypothetical protein